MRIIGCVALAIGVMLGSAYWLAPRPNLATTIQIAAQPAHVWAVLADTKDYAAWTTRMRLVGKLEPGATIENIEGSGDDQMVFWPKVLVVSPDHELRWLGHFKVPGLFDAEHYFLLQPSGSGTLLTQGEEFSGIALWFYDVHQLVPDFVDFNQRLKARAERP